MDTTYKKFRVEFFDPDYDIDAPNADDDFHGYRAEVPVNLPEIYFQRCLHHTPGLEILEMHYGTLDLDGDEKTIGYCSNEVSMTYAEYVFSELCRHIKEFITGPKTEQFIGTKQNQTQ